MVKYSKIQKMGGNYVRRAIAFVFFLLMSYATASIAEAIQYQQTTDKEIRFLNVEWGCSVDEYKSITYEKYKDTSEHPIYGTGFFDEESETSLFDAFDEQTSYNVKSCHMWFLPIDNFTYYKVAGYELSRIDSRFYYENDEYHLYMSSYYLDSESDLGSSIEEKQQMFIREREDLIEKLSYLYGSPNEYKYELEHTSGEIYIWVGANNTACCVKNDKSELYVRGFHRICYFDLDAQRELVQLEKETLNLDGL